MSAVVEEEAQAYWVERIQANLTTSVESIFALALSVVECQAALKDGGGYYKVLEAVGMDDSTARKLAAIARSPLPSVNTVHALPPRWGTLYELSHLTLEDLNDAIEDGSIYPSMTRAQATELHQAEEYDPIRDSQDYADMMADAQRGTATRRAHQDESARKGSEGDDPQRGARPQTTVDYELGKLLKMLSRSDKDLQKIGKLLNKAADPVVTPAEGATFVAGAAAIVKRKVDSSWPAEINLAGWARLRVAVQVSTGRIELSLTSEVDDSAADRDEAMAAFDRLSTLIGVVRERAQDNPNVVPGVRAPMD